MNATKNLIKLKFDDVVEGENFHYFHDDLYEDFNDDEQYVVTDEHLREFVKTAIAYGGWMV